MIACIRIPKYNVRNIRADVNDMRWCFFGHILFDENAPANKAMPAYFQRDGIHGYCKDQDLPGKLRKITINVKQLILMPMVAFCVVTYLIYFVFCDNRFSFFSYIFIDAIMRCSMNILLRTLKLIERN